MRQAIAAIVLLAVAGIGWLLWGGSDPAPPPAPAGVKIESSTDTPTARGGRDAAAPRAAVDPVAPAEQPAVSDPAPAAATEDPPAAPPTPAANVIVLAHDARSRAPLAAFACTFRRAGGDLRVAGADGRAELTLAPDARGELLVEADGHVPNRQPVTAPAAAAPPRTLELFLDPAGARTGIAITAVDLDGEPVPYVRVETWRLPPDAVLGDGWRRSTPLWSRRTGDPEGHYVLPELEPGDYGIRLRATDADGEALPLQPFVATFALSGSNGFDEHAVLEPGCLLGLELVDAAGRALDPRAAPIALDLRRAGADPTTRRWVQRGDGTVLAADDAPPAAGTCWLDEAVADGLYRLRISVDGELRLDRSLALRAGERQLERCVVP